MCGIVGIIKKKNLVSNEEIKSMLNKSIHRGPDAQGIYIDNNVGLGHNRLSILDLSSDGKQPMIWNNKYIITYNGEIYNYIELRKELKKYGYKFKTKTDTEVILAAYDKWGINCVNRFNGMWAFAIYDKEKNIIFCSRDRFGIKPFYYKYDKTQFIFASEIKQLIDDEPEVNMKILTTFLVTSYLDYNDETFFKNIYRLAPSENLIFNINNFSLKRYKYYNLYDRVIEKNYKEKDAIEYFEELFFSSIKLRLRSDVKVATSLSGGLDSSAIVAFASQEYRKQSGNIFSAIHAKSIDKKTDESYYAKLVQKDTNINLTYITPTKEDFINNIDDVIYTQEEPFGGPSVFMQYFVMREAKKNKNTVMLDGQGADEVLLGYMKHYPAYLDPKNPLLFIRDYLSIVKNSKLTLNKLFQYYIFHTMPSIKNTYMKIISKNIKQNYMCLVDFDISKQNADSYKSIKDLQIFELMNNMQKMLRYEDKNSMRHSIETRLPFLDYRVVEFLLSIDKYLKIKNGWTKYILRKILDKKISKEVVWRKNKFGYESPMNKWLEDKNFFYKQIKKSKILNEIYATIPTNLKYYDLWKLYNIAKWEEIYNVKVGK